MKSFSEKKSDQLLEADEIDQSSNDPGNASDPETNKPGEVDTDNNEPGDVLPKLTGKPDWIAEVKKHDLEVATQFARIFPKGPSPLSNGAMARKYYRKRRTGELSAKDVALMARWHHEAHSDIQDWRVRVRGAV